MWKDHLKGNGPRFLTLPEFFELTPLHLFRMFFREIPNETPKPPEIDRIAFLKNINLHRASIGQSPETPFWLLPEVPRG